MIEHSPFDGDITTHFIVTFISLNIDINIGNISATPPPTNVELIIQIVAFSFDNLFIKGLYLFFYHCNLLKFVYGSLRGLYFQFVMAVD